MTSVENGSIGLSTGGLFKSFLCHDVVRATSFISTQSRYFSLLERFRVHSDNVARVKKLFQVIFDSGGGDMEFFVEFEVSVDCSRRKGELVLGHELEKDPFSLGLRHARTVGGFVCISSEPTKFTTPTAIFYLLAHSYPNRGKLLSSWPHYTSVDHELGVKVYLLGAKKPTGRLPPADAQLMAKNRMYTYALDRLKAGGTIAAQTPSRASAPLQIGTLDGANARAVTATDQSTQTGAKPRPGGGRRVGV